MGAAFSKITYSGTGPNYDSYHRELTMVAGNNELVPGTIIRFEKLGAMIVIAIENNSIDEKKISEDYYSHILHAKHSDGSVNNIYLKAVTNDDADEYMKIRKPPAPPPMPDFRYKMPGSTTADVITETANKSGVSIHDITADIDRAIQQ